MRRLSLVLTCCAAACASLATVVAQPPEGRGGPPPGRGDHLRDALNANGDHELDADEIKNASAAIAALDANGNGRIDHEEFRPLPPPPHPGGEAGFRGPPPGERGPDGPPPRGSEDGPPREGRPPREGGFRDSERGRGEAGGRPSPERFVERAMSFDADGDGKLDKAELEKFAAEMAQRVRGAMAERGGPRGGGFREGDGPRRGPGGGPEGGDRPERPRRPE
jgi:hypothetical protein